MATKHLTGTQIVQDAGDIKVLTTEEVLGLQPGEIQATIRQFPAKGAELKAQVEGLALANLGPAAARERQDAAGVFPTA